MDQKQLILLTIKRGKRSYSLNSNYTTLELLEIQTEDTNTAASIMKNFFEFEVHLTKYLNKRYDQLK